MKEKIFMVLDNTNRRYEATNPLKSDYIIKTIFKTGYDTATLILVDDELGLEFPIISFQYPHFDLNVTLLAGQRIRVEMQQGSIGANKILIQGKFY